MKKFTFFLCIMLFSGLAIAATASAVDVEYGYSATSITSADGLITDADGLVTSTGAGCTTNDHSEDALVIEDKTSIGLIQTELAVNLPQVNRQLSHEVGWQIF